MLSELAFPHIRCCLSAIPSDLMKSTAVDESLSTMNQQFCSREKQLLQLLQQNEKSTQTTNYVNVWILSLWTIVICNEVCHRFLNNGSTYLNWYNTIVSGWCPKCQFNCSYCCLVITSMCVN